MENFCIDDQTFSDLNIFSENPHSIYNLFKGTKTLAARNKLKEMMQHPSHNVNELILRRDAIRYFYQIAPDLDIRNEELDLIELTRYLKNFIEVHSTDATPEYLLNLFG